MRLEQRPLETSSRVFEPELAWSEAPPEPRAEDFAERQIGVLVEQGNFERARVLLAKRVAAGEREAGLFLDAIRVERSAAPGGEAWQAWLTRALSAGVPVAGRLPGLLPVSALRAYLARLQIGWAVLEQQPDRRAARELLCLRLEQQLLLEPAGALAEIEDPALHRGAQQDPELQRVALAVMAAVVWRYPARVLVLAPRYGVPLASAGPPSAQGLAGPEPFALLCDAYRLQVGWDEACREQSWPPPLERALRGAWLLSRASGRRVYAELQADLRARPRDYLRCADEVVRVSPPLSAWLQGTLGRAFDELCGPPPCAPQALQAPLAGGARAVWGDPLQRVWLGARVLAAAAFAAALWRIGVTGLLAGPPAVVVLWALRRALDALLYRRNLRALLLELMVTHGAAPAALAAGLRGAAMPGRRRLAARCERDRALALIGALCAHAQPPAGAPLRAGPGTAP